jgi:hypothetical protein
VVATEGLQEIDDKGDKQKRGAQVGDPCFPVWFRSACFLKFTVYVLKTVFAGAQCSFSWFAYGSHNRDLFVAEGDYGIHAHGATRRNVSGESGHSS